VHQPEYGANTPYIVVSIKITLSARLLDSNEIRILYVEKGLSAAQIAKRLNFSESLIASKLDDLGLKGCFEIKRNQNPENYRLPVAPYGYLVRDGKLLTNTKELVICRLVVNLIDRDGLSHSEAARELSRKGFKTRIGKSKWDSKTIYNIYHRWKGKI
jgi:transposase